MTNGEAQQTQPQVDGVQVGDPGAGPAAGLPDDLPAQANPDGIPLPATDATTQAPPVLVVAYRNIDALRRCLDSIHTQTVVCEAFVHDNSLINIGLTRATNKLLTLAMLGGHRYAIWVSHDTILQPDTVEEAVKFMDEHPNCAVAGMKQLDVSNPDFITHGGTADAYPAGVHLTGSVSAGDHNVSKRFGWVNMAACIFRMEAIIELGPLDERYFLYFNDSDWCLAAGLAGYEVWYCASAVVHHESHGCARNPSPEQFEILQADTKAFEEKWAAYFDEAE